MNHNKLTAAAAAILMIFLPFCWGSEMHANANERALRPPFSEMLTSMFFNFKSIFNRAQPFFFPPNLDFRGSSKPREEGNKERMMDRGGAPEDTLKEAVAESVGKTKATVEESAKSAAELATKTIKETKEKVKRTLSPPRSSEDEEEL
ncbi:hypothetical protein M5689_018295 [Euphorbia peplus]|nr:hypothetical protein M5689_018295 [Euphorbia peplus]